MSVGLSPDTLLNVFLAIAVDNLANAQELTAAEEADEKANNEICDESEDMDEQEADHCVLDMDGKTAGDLCSISRAIDGISNTILTCKILHAISNSNQRITFLESFSYQFKKLYISPYFKKIWPTVYSEEECEEEESPFGGPRPMVPYTSMFFLSPSNPWDSLLFSFSIFTKLINNKASPSSKINKFTGIGHSYFGMRVKKDETTLQRHIKCHVIKTKKGVLKHLYQTKKSSSE